MEVHVPGFRPSLRSLARSESGVTALEYGLIVALIGVAAIGAMSGVGEKLDRNLDIVVAAVSDPPALEDDPSVPNDFDDGTVSDPAGEVSVADDSAPGGDGGGNSIAPTADEKAGRSSGGENAGPGTGRAGPTNTAAASTADGSGSGNRPTGFSGAGGMGGFAGGGTGTAAAGGDSAAKPGAGQDGAPGEESPLFGQDSSSATSHGATAFGTGNTVPTQVGASASGGKARSTDAAPGGSGESALKSAFILLLWLCLGIGVIILGCKIALRAAAKKDAEEQLEDWEPASFGEKGVTQLG
jgi:Flp pilus assembly pilin Flp